MLCGHITIIHRTILYHIFCIVSFGITMYCTIFFCIVSLITSYCVVLYHVVLYILHYFVSQPTVSYRTILYCIVSCIASYTDQTSLYHTVILCHIILFCTVSTHRHSVLYCIMLHCIILYYNVSYKTLMDTVYISIYRNT